MSIGGAVKLYEQGKFAEAEAALRRHPGVMSNRHLLEYLASSLFAQRKYQESFDCYERLVTVSRVYQGGRVHLPSFYFNMGKCLQNMGRHDQAEAYLLKSLELKPDQANVHEYLGWAYLTLGRVDDAELECNKALELDGERLEARLDLMKVLLDKGDFEGVLNHAAIALAQSPEEQLAWFRKGRAHTSLHEFDAAAEAYETVLKIKPDDWAARFNLGRVYSYMDEEQKAEAQLRTVLENDPTDIEARIDLSICFNKQGQHEAALVEAEQVVKQDSSEFRGWRRMGISHTELGQYEQAERYLLQAHELAPNVPEIHYDLGLLYFQQGYHNQAELCFLQAQKLGDEGFEDTYGEGIRECMALIREERILGHDIDYVLEHAGDGPDEPPGMHAAF